MKTDHTPEPWRIGTPPPNGEQTIGNEKGLMVAVATTGHGVSAEANARRIVACVNACAGIPDEQLYDQEPGCLLSAMVEQEQEIMAITKQRDELLAALEKMNRAYVNLMENARDRIIMLGGDCDPVDVMERSDPNLRESRAAIASAKGGAA